VAGLKGGPLGFHLGGLVGELRRLVAKTWANFSLGLWLTGEESPKKLRAQIFARQEALHLQTRRPLFSVYPAIWSHIRRAPPGQPWKSEACLEVLVALALMPARPASLRAALDEQVAASDEPMGRVGVLCPVD
jgi:hypothetical protein